MLGDTSGPSNLEWYMPTGKGLKMFSHSMSRSGSPLHTAPPAFLSPDMEAPSLGVTGSPIPKVHLVNVPATPAIKGLCCVWWCW